MNRGLKARWLTPDQQRVWRLYLLGSARIDQYLDEDLRTFGIDLAEYEILVCLSESENWQLRMSDLADQVHQSRSRLSHAITRLGKNGLVTRRRSKADRRGVYARLTDKGFNLLKQAAPHHVEAVRRILVDAVTPEDYQSLGRLMECVLNVED